MKILQYRLCIAVAGMDIPEIAKYLDKAYFRREDDNIALCRCWLTKDVLLSEGGVRLHLTHNKLHVYANDTHLTFSNELLYTIALKSLSGSLLLQRC